MIVNKKLKGKEITFEA